MLANLYCPNASLSLLSDLSIMCMKVSCSDFAYFKGQRSILSMFNDFILSGSCFCKALCRTLQTNGSLSGFNLYYFWLQYRDYRLRYLVGNMGMLYLFQSMKFISEDAHVGSPV